VLSVSSERAFSQGGITISKHRNRLQGNIVEALQCVKCAIQDNLLFRDAAPSSTLEADLNSEDFEQGEGEGCVDDNNVDDEAWDKLLIDEDDDT
jgi:hypothetical protein